MTALHWTAYKGHTEVVELLLEKGANIENGYKVGQNMSISFTLLCYAVL